MEPVTGFFEYGIAALLGVASMVILSIYSLSCDGNYQSDQNSVNRPDGSGVREYPLFKKAA